MPPGCVCSGHHVTAIVDWRRMRRKPAGAPTDGAMKKSRPRRAGPQNREIRQVGAGQMRRGRRSAAPARSAESPAGPGGAPAGACRGQAAHRVADHRGPRAGRPVSNRSRLGNGTGRAGGVLVLHVAGAAALELQHSELQILERINGFFGYPAITRLRLIQAPPLRSSARPERPADRLRVGCRRTRAEPSGAGDPHPG